MTSPYRNAILGLGFLLSACGGSPESEESAAGPTTYTARGQVVTLPADNNGELRLAHEAIDDFVAADGEVVGMDAMTMSFALSANAAPDDLAQGDIVEFDLSVDWSATQLATVTRVHKLPPTTELIFGTAAAPE
jgi:Cu/Ag efflux protein CusF